MVRQIKNVRLSEPQQGHPVKRVIPNILSMVRILMTIPIVMLIEKDPGEQSLLLLVPIGIAIVSDLLDGHLARRWNAVSKTGLILDPLGDKILTLSVTARLLYIDRIDPWIAVLLISRDFFILLGGGVITLSRKSIPSSNKMGKATAITLAALLTTIIFNLRPLVGFLEVVAAVLICVSFFSYIKLFMKSFALPLLRGTIRITGVTGKENDK